MSGVSEDLIVEYQCSIATIRQYSTLPRLLWWTASAAALRQLIPMLKPTPREPWEHKTYQYLLAMSMVPSVHVMNSMRDHSKPHALDQSSLRGGVAFVDSLYTLTGRSKRDEYVYVSAVAAEIVVSWINGHEYYGDVALKRCSLVAGLLRALHDNMKMRITQASVTPVLKFYWNDEMLEELYQVVYHHPTSGSLEADTLTEEQVGDLVATMCASMVKATNNMIQGNENLRESNERLAERTAAGAARQQANRERLSRAHEAKRERVAADRQYMITQEKHQRDQLRIAYDDACRHEARLVQQMQQTPQMPHDWHKSPAEDLWQSDLGQSGSVRNPRSGFLNTLDSTSPQPEPQPEQQPADQQPADQQPAHSDPPSVFLNKHGSTSSPPEQQHSSPPTPPAEQDLRADAKVFLPGVWPDS
jgi:hypothetical protein